VCVSEFVLRAETLCTQSRSCFLSHTRSQVTPEVPLSHTLRGDEGSTVCGRESKRESVRRETCAMRDSNTNREGKKLMNFARTRHSHAHSQVTKKAPMVVPLAVPVSAGREAVGK